MTQQQQTPDEIQIISDFKPRRQQFDNFLKATSTNEVFFTCPSCGFPTLTERDEHEICDICKWQDDGQDDQDADEIKGGPNSDLSLTDSRLKIGKELIQLAKNLNGKLITNPDKFFTLLHRHIGKMEILSNKLKSNSDNDTLRAEWVRTRELIKHDLIEK